MCQLFYIGLTVVVAFYCQKSTISFLLELAHRSESLFVRVVLHASVYKKTH